MVVVKRSSLIGTSWSICCRIGKPGRANLRFNVPDASLSKRHLQQRKNASNASDKKMSDFSPYAAKDWLGQQLENVGTFVWIASFQSASGAEQERRSQRIMSKFSEKMLNIMIAARNAVHRIYENVPGVTHRKHMEISGN